MAAAALLWASSRPVQTTDDGGGDGGDGREDRCHRLVDDGCEEAIWTCDVNGGAGRRM